MIYFLYFAIVFVCNGVLVASKNLSFDKNYVVSWGDYHVERLNQGREIQLTMDQNQGGAGFGSKVGYGSGFFSMRIKFPESKNTAGVVVAYYLKSLDKDSDEADFEFLGDEEGKPITLQTNVITNGVGREQRFNLWFDPTQDFHTYSILWNQYQMVFLVDDTPIRVFKNDKNIGVDYPSKEMYINGTIWDATWATDGGRVQTNWTYAPFQAHFQGFSIHGCSTTYSCCPKMWWNGQQYATLNPTQIKSYENARKNYMNYDYCSDLNRNHNNTPPECPKRLHTWFPFCFLHCCMAQKPQK